MSTPQERIVALEAAFRQRFFPHVPKIESKDRASWTEEQHDIDRLSRCLAAYVLVGSCGVTDAIAAGAITDGSNDGGIDALYFDRAGNRLLFIQAKFKRNGTAPSQEENLKTINGIKALQSRRFNEFNQAFQDRLDEIEEALDTPGVNIEVVLAFLGDNLGPHVTNDLNALQAEINILTAQMSWRIAGLTQIHGWLLAEQTPRAVNVQVVLENWAAVTEPRKAVYGLIQAAALAELVAAHGNALFERNIRHYLGSVGVNTAIERTVRRRPTDFFYLNNGLTAVADEITKAPGPQTRCTFGLKNVSIVNGAQTAGAIATASISGEISPNAKVLLTIIEVGAGADDIALLITKARNHQNAVRGIDFAALDPNQERLRLELAVAGVTYYYRPSAEALARKDDTLTVEEAAIALACFSFPVLRSVDIDQATRRGIENAITFVVTAKKEVGRLWDQDSAPYGKLFTGTLSGVRMCRVVRIYRLIDQILAGSEQSENTYYRRMFFRHARYFIIAFVAHRGQAVINRAELVISEGDKTVISRLTNELSELIYAESLPLQGIKGYRAIFSNLTDSQPLADGVLVRLAQQDAAAASRSTDSGASPS